MEFFQKNLANWASSHQEDENSIKRLKELNPSHSTFGTTSSGKLNLRVDVPEGAFDLYSDDPVKEATEWFASLDLRHINTIYIYGIGLGYYYEAAKSWLSEDRNRYLVFIEDDSEVMHRFLETEQCNDLGILDNPQVFIFSLGHRTEQIIQLTHITTLLHSSTFIFTGLKSYALNKTHFHNEFKSTISFMLTMNMLLYAESSTYGVAFFRNFFLNILNLPNSYFANGLMGKFEGIPAIICGAGPSLNKNIDVLSTLGDRALIFAGGTALNALNGKGVMPHFGVGIDPNPDQFTRLVMNHAFELPFIYRCRMLYEALEMVHGDRLYVTGTGGYDIGKWFEKQLDVDVPELQEGFNVLNFSVMVAHALGCNPIICVGIDLAYSEGDSYAAGVTNHPIHSRRSNFRTKNIEDELIVKNDIFGKPVYTLWKWVAESLWYTHFAAAHPNCTLINATEGGIGFTNIPNMPLAEVKETYLEKQLDIKAKLHGEIQNSPLPETFKKEKITATTHILVKSLIECLKKCLKLMDLLTNEIEKPLQDETLKEKISREEDQLHKEIAYEVILKRFSDDYLKRSSLDAKRLEADKNLLSEEEYARKKAILNFERYNSLKEAVQNNSDIIHYTLIEDEKPKATPINVEKHPIPIPKNDEDYFFDQTTFRIKDPELQLDYNETINQSDLQQESFHYPSQKIKMEKFYLKNLLHGPSTFYAENGRILCRNWFINGKKEGKTWSYHANGSLYSLQIFQEGLPIGLHQYFYPNGLLKSILPYHKGKLHGEVRLYGPEGNLIRKLSFVNGLRSGREQIWNTQGQLLVDCQFEADRPVGLSRLWHTNGVLCREILYDNNSQKIESKEWDLNGILIEKEEGQDEDYFDQVNRETHNLTVSLNQMVKDMSAITPLISEKFAFDTPPLVSGTSSKLQDELSTDLDKLQKEMQYLQSLDVLLREQFAQTEESKEAIWKTPESRREMEKQFDHMKDKINQELESIQKGIKTVIGSILDQEQDKRSDSDSKDTQKQ